MTKKSDITTSMIAAMGENRVIGNNNALIWNIPTDMQWFRDKTRGKPVIMGRKTFESIGRLLPKRLNIVISRQEDFSLPDFPEAEISNSLETAIDIANTYANKNDLEEIFIIGGAQIYALGLPLTDRLYLTHINKSYEGDTFFPEVDMDNWTTQFAENHQETIESPSFTFKIYERKLAI